MSDEEKADALAFLASKASALRGAERTVLELRGERDDAMAWCRQAGVSSALISRTAGVSIPRVTQIVPAKQPQDTESPEKTGVDARVSNDESVDTSTNGHVDMPTYRLVDSMKTVSEFYSERDRRRVFSRRDTYGTYWFSLAGLAERASIMAADTTVRLLVCGHPNDDLPPTESVRRWASADPGPGWTVTKVYNRDPESPTVHLDGPSGRKLVVMRAGAWFGSNDLDPLAVNAAWVELEAVIGRAFDGAVLGDTPSTTGRQLWLRTLGRETRYPVASDEIRELIQETSGQGRIELLKPLQDTAPSFTQYDGRLMYAAHTWGLGVGEPRAITRAQIEAEGQEATQKAFRGRGWWHVVATVPPDWSHVGILPHKRDGEGWEYPAEPGRTFETWCDGSEVHAAVSHGWHVDVLERIEWTEGKPLNRWRDKLVDAYNATENPLVRKAIRAMLLFAIGAFASRVHPVSHQLPIHRAGEVPPTALPNTVSMVDDMVVWQEPGTLSPWQKAMQHPEWSACIWGRTRAAMVRAALHEPRANLIGFATDALYVAAPGTSFGADNGQKIGALRIKGQLSTPVDMPTTWPEVYRLRDAAETEWEARA